MKKLSKLESSKRSKLDLKMGKGHEQQFTNKLKTQKAIAIVHMTRCISSLIMREYKILLPTYQTS